MLPFLNRRFFSNNKKITLPSAKKKYAETLLLPRTEFPMKISPEKRNEVENGIQKVCRFGSLYSWQREKYCDKLQFTLLDGPPYANGPPHMGHAVNKILKDIILRYKLVTGHKIHFVPGWDCHGLPIELKVISGDDGTARKLTPLFIRRMAQEFALDAIKGQKKAFQRWGLIANWNDEGCYRTIDKDYQVAQIKAFYELYKKDLVFRDFKPVYWSPSTRTALAEAELEYNPQHESTSVYVKFKLQKFPATLLSHSDLNIHALIWTTTPWTLPAQECIAYSEKIQYSLVRCKQSKELYLIASDLLSTLEQILSKQLETVVTFPGKSLAGTTYIHPMKKEELFFLPGIHVTTEKGTGLVHTCPSHGLEDHALGLQFGLPLRNILDDEGVYKSNCGDERLVGKSVLGNGNDAVIDLFGDSVISRAIYKHNYPYDWRSKKPVIVRPSLQWFFNTEKLRKRALECLDQIEIFPFSMKLGLVNQVAKRPNWCISRQRVWGLPIPAFYKKPTGEIVLNDDLINHWCKLITKHDGNAWWQLPNEELLPKSILEKNNLPVNDVYEKSKDILDIWFDSGISWKHVLSDANFEADLCLEGLDQSRGWFQSLLWTSIALQNKPPYKKLFFHGFTLDEEGRKMSKSLGNVIDPQILVDGNKKTKCSALGADVLRWWVAAHTVERPNVWIKNQVLDECAAFVQKVRAVFRFMLSNLRDFDIDTNGVALGKMDIVDRYILHLLHETRHNIICGYDSFKFDDVAVLITNFITRDVSAFYLNIIRDRLYCSEKSAEKRRSCQTALHHLFCQLVYFVAPILPHLAEEAFLFHPTFGEGRKLVFENQWPESLDSWQNFDAKLKIEAAIQLRNAVNKEVTENAIDVNEVNVIVQADQSLLNNLKDLQSDQSSCHSSLCEVLQVANVTLMRNEPEVEKLISLISGTLMNQRFPFKLFLIKSKNGLCNRCRRYMVTDSSKDICSTCLNVIGSQWG